MRPNGRVLLSSFSVLAWCLSANSQTVLLIPDSATDSVGLYSSIDGSYLSDLIVDSDPGPAGILDTPISAVIGPDGLIYVSDQLKDSVLRYDQTGAFVDVFCGPASGIDNVRGIAFRNGELLVCYASTSTSSDRGIARFSMAGSRLPNLIQDGIDPFDVFVFGGDILASDIAGGRVVRYAGGGGPAIPLFNVAFPEQIAARPSSGRLLNIAHDANQISEFDLSGAVFATVSITGLGRGIAELGNGRYLITNSNSVREINPATGATVRVIRSGSGFRFIERVQLGPVVCANPICAAADLDGNCLIDLVDLTNLLAAFGSTGVPGTVVGDINDDGAVDLVDLTNMLSLFGSDCNQ